MRTNMPQQVCNGATLQCMMGMAPSSLVVLPVNPSVAAATAAALGVLTPMPCIPVTTSPWVPGAPTVILGGNPTLDNTCTLMCMWAGVIQVVSPGEFTVNVP